MRPVKRDRALCGLTLGILLGALPLAALEVIRMGPRTDTEYQDRLSSIQEEVAAGSAAGWEGEYYWGDGLGANLSLHLSPTAGFAYEWHGCLGLYDYNHGSLKETREGLRLQADLEEWEAYLDLGRTFVPIRWGDRHYLIPQDRLVAFCNAVNSKSEPRENRHGWFFLRVGDENIEVTGLPDMPARYRSCLLEQPIEATLTKIMERKIVRPDSESDVLTLRATIDKGTADGVFEGMVLNPKDRILSIVMKVASVSEHQAEIEIWQHYFEDRPTPSAGWRLTTLRW